MFYTARRCDRPATLLERPASRSFVTFVLVAAHFTAHIQPRQSSSGLSNAPSVLVPTLWLAAISHIQSRTYLPHSRILTGAFATRQSPLYIRLAAEQS